MGETLSEDETYMNEDFIRYAKVACLEKWDKTGGGFLAVNFMQVQGLCWG